MLHQINQFSVKKDEYVELHRGGSASHFVRLSEWENESANYFHRFFLKRLNDILCVPQKGDDVVETLKKWCAFTKSKNKGALIVQNLNLLEQVRFLNATKYLSGMLKNQDKPYSRYLVYNCSKNVILYLRTAMVDKKRNINLQKEIDMCISDITILITLYQDELQKSGVKIIGLVITKSEFKTSKLNCEFCRIFVISKNIFDNLPVFLKWWEKFELWIDIPEANLGKVNPETYKIFSMKILSLMACNRCMYLPNFTQCIASQIEQTCLLLNPEQMDVIYSPYKFTILRGNFGTGKSIIIQKKLENLANLLQKHEIIYFINYDPKSNALIGFESYVRKNVCLKNKHKIKIIGNKMSLKLSGIFGMIVEKHESTEIKSVHLFIDEYNGEDLTINEVQLVKEKLQGISLFRNSVVFIAVQPIEKECVDSFEHTHETYNSKANMFHELEDTFQMEELTCVMRTTVQINRLAELAQEFLETKQNEFIHPNTYDPGSAEQYVMRPTEESKRLVQLTQGILDRNESIHPKTFAAVSATLSAIHSGFRKKILKTSSETSFTSVKHESNTIGQNTEKGEGNTFTKVLEIRKPIELKSVVDLDEAFKQVAENNIMNVKHVSKLKTISSYRYMKESEIGHQIESSTPKLFRLFPFKDNFNNVISLAAILDLIEIKQGKTVILHFEQKPPLDLLNALDFYPQSFTFDVEAFFHRKSQVSILVTNFFYIRGMEFENVIIMINAIEYYLRHYLPEAITRCTKSLSIVVLQEKNVSQKEGSMNEVITVWENQLPAVVEKWTVEGCEKCKRKCDYYCCQNNAENKVIYINVLSDEYKQMKKQFDTGRHLEEEFEENTVSHAAQM